MTSDRPEEEPMTAVAEPAVLVHEVTARLPMHYLTFADLPSIDVADARFEIQDGELLIMVPPIAWHDEIAARVRDVLRPNHAHVARELHIPAGNNARFPDVLALSVDWHELVRRRASTVAADEVEIAVEIISHVDDDPTKDRAAVARDRVVKFREYAQAGIPEYWIVDEVPDDPEDASVEIYRLKDGAYALVRTVLLSDLLAEGTAEKTA
jgi:Uma2 family endonuclease